MGFTPQCTYRNSELPSEMTTLCLYLYSRSNTVSMLTHTYLLKPLRKIKMTVCNHQADSPLYVWSDVWSSGLQVIYDTECPFWDQVSLNNTNPTQPFVYTYIIIKCMRLEISVQPLANRPDLHVNYLSTWRFACHKMNIKTYDSETWVARQTSVS